MSAVISAVMLIRVIKLEDTLGYNTGFPHPNMSYKSSLFQLPRRATHALLVFLIDRLYYCGNGFHNASASIVSADVGFLGVAVRECLASTDILV